MSVFIWDNVSNLTESWHSSGGLVVVAFDLNRAREVIKGQVTDECSAFTKEPDLVAPSDPAIPERVFVFPDAGCC